MAAWVELWQRQQRLTLPSRDAQNPFRKCGRRPRALLSFHVSQLDNYRALRFDSGCLCRLSNMETDSTEELQPVPAALNTRLATISWSGRADSHFHWFRRDSSRGAVDCSWLGSATKTSVYQRRIRPAEVWLRCNNQSADTRHGLTACISTRHTRTFISIDRRWDNNVQVDVTRAESLLEPLSRTASPSLTRPL